MSSIVGIIGNSSPNSYSKPIYTLQLPPFELVKQALNTDWDSPAPSTAIPALDVGSPHFQMGISDKPLCGVDSLLPATKSASISSSYLRGLPVLVESAGAASSRKSVAERSVLPFYNIERILQYLPKKPFRLPPPLFLKATASPALLVGFAIKGIAFYGLFHHVQKWYANTFSP